jgi:hypothetical protein
MSAGTTHPPKLAEMPDLVQVPELAAWLRIGINAAYELVRRKDVKSIKVGRRLLVPKAELARLAGE